jgi:hypothetical protein
VEGVLRLYIEDVFLLNLVVNLAKEMMFLINHVTLIHVSLLLKKLLKINLFLQKLK